MCKAVCVQAEDDDELPESTLKDDADKGKDEANEPENDAEEAEDINMADPTGRFPDKRSALCEEAVS